VVLGLSTPLNLEARSEFDEEARIRLRIRLLQSNKVSEESNGSLCYVLSIIGY
jgi:hypothetical protein